jgi:hypothetical protein
LRASEFLFGLLQPRVSLASLNACEVGSEIDTIFLQVFLRKLFKLLAGVVFEVSAFITELEFFGVQAFGYFAVIPPAVGG